MMKKTIFLMLLAIIAGTLSAQEPVSKNPSIVDFVSMMVSEPEDELMGALNDMWERYLAHKPQEGQNNLVVDKKNGFVRFEDNYPESESQSITEICYWNCDDKRHKLVAFTNRLFQEGKPVEGQYTGTSFVLYDKEEQVFTPIDNDEVGADESLFVPYTCYGFDGDDYFVEDKKGVRTIMTEEEYYQWIENRPIPVILLPQHGKDIQVKTYSGKKVIEERKLVWDGGKFQMGK